MLNQQAIGSGAAPGGEGAQQPSGGRGAVRKKRERTKGSAHGAEVNYRGRGAPGHKNSQRGKKKRKQSSSR